MPASVRSKYIHALRFRWLNRFYDTIVRATPREAELRESLVEQVDVGSGRVLDLGCGTATLTIMLKQRYPAAHVIGLDGDSEVLAIASRKAEEAGVEIDFQLGLAWEAPFEPGTFDRAVSSLVFHHLATDDKRRTLQRLRYLLKPGGGLHIADWGRPQNALMRVAFLGVQLLDGFETTRDSVQGRLPELMEEAGFIDVEETHREMTMAGTLSFYRAATPT